jgi:hypothetical protein
MPRGVWKLYSFTLNMPTAMYTETMGEFQHTTQLNPENRNYAPGLELAGVPLYRFDDVASSMFFRYFP